MKRLLLLMAFLLLGILLSGCNNPPSDKNTNKSDQENLVNNNESIKAEETLVSFFAYLSNQEYEKALTLFALDDPTNSWEGLENFSLPEERNNKVQVLRNYCEATRTCLQAKVIEIKKETSDVYNLVVQFKNTDGSVFVLGPCCGATEEEMPSQDTVTFKVKKINNIFKVTTAPIYVP